jgi:hypothetical protein
MITPCAAFVHGAPCVHTWGFCLQLDVYAYTSSNCLDEEYNYYSFDGCASISLPPAVWKQTLTSSKGTLKLSIAATLEECGTVSPGGIPNSLQGTLVQVDLDLVCKPSKSTSKCINTFNGMHWCPACNSDRCCSCAPAMRSCGHSAMEVQGGVHAWCLFTSRRAGCQTGAHCG